MLHSILGSRMLQTWVRMAGGGTALLVGNLCCFSSPVRLPVSGVRAPEFHQDLFWATCAWTKTTALDMGWRDAFGALECCSRVVLGGELRVDRFGQAEATGRGDCLACLRRCLPGCVLREERWRMAWVRTIGRCLSFSWRATVGGVGSLCVSSSWLRG